MPRPKRRRRICSVPEHVSFSPDNTDQQEENDPSEKAFSGLKSGMSSWLTKVAESYSGKTGIGNDVSDSAEKVVLTLDEFETIRLVDYEKQTHGQCAAQMDISRTTVTEIYENARQKIADCLVNGKRLVIEGGDYRICNGSASYCCNKICNAQDSERSKDDE